MALLKLGSFITQASGKLGGQVFTHTRNGTVIKNIVQPPRQASQLQSYQRLTTAGLTNSWQFLTQSQRNSFIAAAVNYQWIDRVGELRTRNGFQTFCFLNQNLEILGQPPINIAPPFVSITKPTIADISSDAKEFVIEGANTNSSQTYAAFCQVHNSVGAVSLTPNPVHITNVSATDLSNGFDFAPAVKDYFGIVSGIFSVVIEVVAINASTGNRDLNPPKINAIVEYVSSTYMIGIWQLFLLENDLNNSIGSFGPWSNNNILFDPLVPVNKAAFFNGSAFGLLPSADSLSRNASLRTFSILVYPTSFANTGHIYRSNLSIRIETNRRLVVVMSMQNNVTRTIIINNFFALNTLVHITLTYDSANSTARVYKDGVLSGSNIFTNSPIRSTVFSDILGSFNTSPFQPFNGYLRAFYVWQRVLSQTEISDLASDQLSGVFLT